MGRVGLEMVGECLVKAERGMTYPKRLVLSLLSRTLGNLKAVAILTQHRLIVEARVLARCCVENMFMVGGLHSKGAEFAKLMTEDDQAGRNSRIRFTLENDAVFESLPAELQQTLKRQQETFKNGPKVAFLRPKDAASELTGQGGMYLLYSQMSADAVHPTITALGRNWAPAGSIRTAFFDHPSKAKEEELDETLDLACTTLIVIMVLVNEMHGYPEAGKCARS
jgi:hypothetical protein